MHAFPQPAADIMYSVLAILGIRLEDLAVKRAHEQSGHVSRLLWLARWLARLDSVRYRIACLLRSFAVSSCSCCIDSSIKMQGDPLRADWSSGKSGMCQNSV